MARYIWIFGNAVQDVTVDVDMARLKRTHPDLDQFLRFDDKPRLRQGLRLHMQYGQERFVMDVNLQDQQAEADGFYTLTPGRKYTLTGSLLTTEAIAMSREPYQGPLLHCENVTWGGGGLNVARFLRQLASRPEQVPILYTDLALGTPLASAVSALETTATAHTKGKARTLTQALQYFQQARGGRARAEALLAATATQLARAGTENCLDVYLASLLIEPVLHRPRELVRRNLVFSRFRSTSQATHDKIICRGYFAPCASEQDTDVVQKLLRAYRHDNVGAIVLNSLKDDALFQAGYTYYRQVLRHRPDAVGIVAMTSPMQKFTAWLLADRKRHGGKFPPFILVFNQDEALQFAERFQPGLAPIFATPDAPLNFAACGRIAQVLRAQFPTDPMPRMYITLGARGSVGIDSTGIAVYVSRFTRLNDTIFDTNACGDAYCATITLLEWAKRHGYADLTGIDIADDVTARAREMQYFMAVATAAAYCKATDRFGRIDGSRVSDLLMHTHLASDQLVYVHDLAKGVVPEWAGPSGQPKHARLFEVTETLCQLIA